MLRFALAAVVIALAPATVLIDNPRVRVFRAFEGSLTGVDDGPGVVISLDSATAVWMDNVASQGQTTVAGSLIIVQPRRGPAPLVPAAPAPSSSRAATAC